MDQAEKLVLKHRISHRQKKLDNLKFKLFGRDKFDSKNKYIEGQIDTLLKYFSAQSRINVQQELDFYKIRSQILTNQKLLNKKNANKSNKIEIKDGNSKQITGIDI